MALIELDSRSEWMPPGYVRITWTDDAQRGRQLYEAYLRDCIDFVLLDSAGSRIVVRGNRFTAHPVYSKYIAVLNTIAGLTDEQFEQWRGGMDLDKASRYDSFSAKYNLQLDQQRNDLRTVVCKIARYQGEVTPAVIDGFIEELAIYGAAMA